MMSRARGLALLAGVVLALCAQTRADEQGRVVRVVDGDTLEVRIMDGSNRLEKVRLIGVQAAELKGQEPFSREAREYLRVLAAGERVDLVSDGTSQDRDRFGRLLRYAVFLWGLDVNAELIRTGHARAYVAFPFNKMDVYLKLEAEACRRKAGGWGAGIGWGECRPGLSDKERPAPIDADRVVYISRRGAKYHTADCPTLKGAGMMMPLDQALARGLKPCKLCSPGAKSARRAGASGSDGH